MRPSLLLPTLSHRNWQRQRTLLPWAGFGSPTCAAICNRQPRGEASARVRSGSLPALRAHPAADDPPASPTILPRTDHVELGDFRHGAINDWNPRSGAMELSSAPLRG